MYCITLCIFMMPALSYCWLFNVLCIKNLKHYVLALVCECIERLCYGVSYYILPFVYFCCMAFVLSLKYNKTVTNVGL